MSEEEEARERCRLDARRYENEILSGLMKLEPRHRKIVRLRFGFNGTAYMCKTIGAEMGVSAVRIQQLEHQGIDSIYRDLQTRGIKLDRYWFAWVLKEVAKQQ